MTDLVPLYCGCCTTFISMVPASVASLGAAACTPCYFDEEFGWPCKGPYRYVEYEHDDGTFEIFTAP